MDAVFDLNCAKSCAPMLISIIWPKQWTLLFLSFEPAKTPKIFENKNCNDNALFGDLSLTSQPSKKTVTSLDLQHHGSLLFLHHTDNLLIRHPQGKEHNFYKLLTFILEK